MGRTPSRRFSPRLVLAGLYFASGASAVVGQEKYVTAEDGHFFLGDRRIRFWGVNVVNPAGWNHKEIRYMVSRAKACGFNALRLHMYDASLFANNDPNRPSYRINNYEKDDGSPLDFLDYLISCAHEQGLYLYMSFSRAWCAVQPGDYDVLPAKDEADRKAWCEAVKQAGTSLYMPYIDERQGAIFLEAAKNQLRHVNQHTGLSYAEDPRIALWEIHNENNFVDAMLNGWFLNLPEYFKSQLMAKWHAWLRTRYGNTDGLTRAWGSTKTGESLEKETVALAPVRTDATFSEMMYEQWDETRKRVSQAKETPKAYPDARARDVVRFMVDLYDGYNRRFIEAVRGIAPKGIGINVVPIAISSSSADWSLVCHYASSLGTFSTAGNYEVQFIWFKDRPRYPWQTRLEAFPSFAGNTEAGPFAGKPIVGYECGPYRPNAFLAEMPARLGTYAAWNDWDGIFWFGWPGDHHNVEDYKNLLGWPLQNCNSADAYSYHIGLTFTNDEVLHSQLKAQGAMFLNFGIKPALKPEIHTFGADVLYDMYDKSWRANIARIRPDAHTLGARIQVDPTGSSQPAVREIWERRVDFEKRKDFIHGQPYPIDPIPSPARSASGEVTYQWEGPGKGGQLIIDTPQCKSVVGWPGKRWLFKDGWKVDHIQIGTATDKMLPNSEGFGCITIAANDGKPLHESTQIVISMIAKSQNTGFAIDATRAKGGIVQRLGNSVTNVGTLPVIVDRVGGVITGPFPSGAKYHKYSFDLKCYESGDVGSVLKISHTEPMFYCLVGEP